MEPDIEQSLLEYVAPYLKGRTDEISSKMIANLARRIKDFNDLDHDFIAILQDIANLDEAELHNKDCYSELIQNMQNKVIIYFKSAGLFRVYTPEELDKYFAYRVRTYYRRKEVYEVVRDNSPQKIIIMIDSRDREELEKIKQHIINYMQTTQSFSEDNLTIFDNHKSGAYEIVMDKVVDNLTEREVFVSQLLKYIELQEKSAVLSNKMSERVVPEFPGAMTYLVPELKEKISGFVGENVGMVTPLNITINVTNLNVHNGPNVNVHGQTNHVSINNTENNAETNDSDDMDDPFIEYLEESDLEWYVPGEVVDYDILHEEYNNVIEDVSKKFFTKKYLGKLFVKNRRIKRAGTNVQLVKLL